VPESSLIGKSLPRIDAPGKATGATAYTADLKLPAMLVGLILRSPVAHARIVSIDTSRAERLRGVKAVVTDVDFPGARYGMAVKDQTPLAREKVRYIGERVAAVAAIDLETAEEALHLVRVEYEELAPVFDPFEALRADAPLIHEGIDGYGTTVDNIIKHGNVCSMSSIRRGDVEQGFSQADAIFEDTFSTPMVHQAYVEPHTVMVRVEGSGGLTVWTVSPSVFKVRDSLADILGLPRSMVKVVAGQVGGSFGSKNDLRLEPVCAALALRSGRPVRMTMDVQEESADGSPRHASTITLKTGVDKDGLIIARQARMVFDTGAYAEFGPAVAYEAVKMINGPYRVPHLDLEAQCVYTNKISCGCFRSHGTPEPTFARESQMDVIASRLGVDPVELRLRNAVGEGDLSAAGEMYTRLSLQDNLRRAAAFAGWGGQPKPKNRGRGIAVGEWKTGTRPSGVILRMGEHGGVTVTTGCVDVTGSDTMLSQVVASELGIATSEVRIIPVDTDTAPIDAGSSGTRTTHNAGGAARMAAIRMRERLLALAADVLEANPQDLDIADGQVFVKGTPEKTISMARIGQQVLLSSGGNLVESASLQGRPLAIDRAVIEGMSNPGNIEFLHPVQVAEVEVDPDTGEVSVVGLTSIHDIGRAINPASVTGQIEGGVAQGLGYGLLEHLACRDGSVVNGCGNPYPQPCAPDMPEVRPVLVEDGRGLGPYGAKGIGEAPIVPTAPAIANAIFDAVGVRVTSLPVTPEKVLAAMEERD